MGYILGLVVPVGLAVMFYVILGVYGDMCSTLVSASDGDDLRALQEKAFAAFRQTCRSKKKNQPNNQGKLYQQIQYHVNWFRFYWDCMLPTY